MSEDCLGLNVWTPGCDPGAKRPVMVWLHPGGFHGGAGYQYTGSGTLARKEDVVQVEVNHRLNVFGFLHLLEFSDRFPDAGNVGMLDLVAALEWVRDDVTAFGGDPDNVTIFGESGGGAKVSTLMAMPAARGLFHRAIAQSGFALRGVDAEEATQDTLRILRTLSLGPDQVDELQSVPTERLLAAFRDVRGQLGRDRHFSPTVDGRALPRHPWSPDAPAVSADVPFMLGATLDESVILLGALGPERETIFQLDEAEVQERLARYLDVDPQTSRSVAATYQAAHPELSPSERFFRATSDHMMPTSSRGPPTSWGPVSTPTTAPSFPSCSTRSMRMSTGSAPVRITASCVTRCAVPGATSRARATPITKAFRAGAPTRRTPAPP
jgi:para-nitrobenzyl esterase